MDVILVPLLQMIATVVDLYVWALIISVIISWLIAFGVLDTRNRFVYLVSDFFYRITEPALGRIRSFLPNLGGVDISPIILIVVLYFIQGMLMRLAFKLAS
jgi:YggT family protein